MSSYLTSAARAAMTSRPSGRSIAIEQVCMCTRTRKGSSLTRLATMAGAVWTTTKCLRPEWLPTGEAVGPSLPTSTCRRTAEKRPFRREGRPRPSRCPLSRLLLVPQSRVSSR